MPRVSIEGHVGWGHFERFLVKYIGNGFGQVVSVVNFYSNDPSLILLKSTTFREHNAWKELKIIKKSLVWFTKKSI